LVSVIIPAYNAERYLAEAIDSAFSQTYSPVEVIVVNDGSTDGTEVVARGYLPRIKFASQPNGGISKARNTAIEMAEGSFLALLDADDLWTPNKLDLQMAAFRKDPALDIVFGHMVQFLEGCGGDSRAIPGTVPSCAVIRRESFFRVGRFDPEVKLAEFLNWYLLAREKGLREFTVPEVVLRRRIHGDNIGIRDQKDIGMYARLLKASLDRRRAAGGRTSSP
jgi:glycosyltransferase involved in cell wall biosynthesis